ncbi:MAG: lytic transglycosylase [SAR86 cluster bacterium]|uniref:Lytic transglycosylase n=1 Tax=SAR86 cluster bacterium TaxID=2030880 RepID=A0A2A4WX24_9GAMM|nr:MAG: lytic transglycosylase [SAR86 cluster bacterium]
MRKLIRNIVISLLPLFLAACQNSQQLESHDVESGTISSIEETTASPEPSLENSELANEASPLATDADINYDDLWRRIRDGFQLNAHYSHPNVARYIQSYSTQQRYFDLLQNRSSPFLFEIVEEIDRRGLPLEFALLPMVESTYNPNAYSREHAVGLWQFVGATGSSFGLQQDWWFDGRRDPIASTRAALDYMEQLYKQFDEDWLLAIAAYNTGDGNLRRAIRRSEEEEINFWDLNLPGETEAHVPKLLALSAIIADNETWNIELKPLPNEPVLRSVQVGTQIDLSQAATLAEIEYEQLRALNPGYLQWATHPDQPQEMLLPFENAALLEGALAGIDKRDLLTWDRYEIKPGDTLGAIARRLNTRVDILQTFNSLVESRIRAGESLLIPRTDDPALLASAPRVEREMTRQLRKVPAQYKVRNGDNLWVIARRFQLRSKEIAAWNQIPLEELLQPGQILDLRYALEDKNEEPEVQINDSAVVYSVRRGDSMEAIAQRFDIDLQKLLLWNELRIDELIFPGQELQVVPGSLGN